MATPGLIAKPLGGALDGGGFSSRHPAADWKAPVGTPVFAAHEGQILYRHDPEDYGLYATIFGFMDGIPIETLYAHLDPQSPRKPQGTWVRRGELIGAVGLSGKTETPHLHFELRWCGALVDPLQYIG